MKDLTMKSQPGVASIAAGPPVSLRFNSASNPNKVRRGGNLEKLPAADALDASGNIVSGVSGNYTLGTPLPGVTVSNNPGNLNGKLTVTNVQNNMSIDVVLRTNTTPQLTGIYHVVVEVIG
ncbi:hypothetical protein [Pseudomonas putida]|uniref:hypothetical protein n=1 Tax=Pseudomonas putida TaxID=303 RepID=UPI003D9542B8